MDGCATSTLGQEANSRAADMELVQPVDSNNFIDLKQGENIVVKMMTNVESDEELFVSYGSFYIFAGVICLP